MSLFNINELMEINEKKTCLLIVKLSKTGASESR